MISVVTDEVADRLDTLMDTLKEADLKYVELRKLNQRYLFEIDYGELKLIHRKLKENHFQVSLVDSPIGKHKFSFEKEDKLFLKYIRICKILECNYLRIFADVSDLDRYHEIAKENQIMLLIENEKGTKGENYLYLKEMMEKKYSNIRLLYDAENYYSLGMDYMEALRLLKKDIVYVHLRDIKNGKYVNLYDGEIFIDEILNNLQEEVVLSLETHLPMSWKLPKEELFLKCIRRIYEQEFLWKFK